VWNVTMFLQTLLTAETQDTCITYIFSNECIFTAVM
jgi:hypothetical protein